MLDIRLIREKPDFVKERLASRGGNAHAAIDEILDCVKQRRAIETRLQQLNAERKRISKEIGARKGRGEDSSELENQVRGFGDEVALLNQKSNEADAKQRELLLQLPNLPHEKAPLGTDAGSNPVVKTWGEKPQIAEPMFSHVEIADKV